MRSLLCVLVAHRQPLHKHIFIFHSSKRKLFFIALPFVFPSVEFHGGSFSFTGTTTDIRMKDNECCSLACETWSIHTQRENLSRSTSRVSSRCLFFCLLFSAQGFSGPARSYISAATFGKDDTFSFVRVYTHRYNGRPMCFLVPSFSSVWQSRDFVDFS